MSMKELNPLEKRPGISKTLRKKLGAVMLSGATILNPTSSRNEGVGTNQPYVALNETPSPLEQTPQTPAQIEITLNKIAATKTEETIFDNNPEYFRTITKNGDFASEERRKRTESLGKATVFRDVDLLFYKVQKGDTLFSIRNSLSRLPEFSYLRAQPSKIESFNIPPLELVKDMWIPIPLENKERYLTDEQFARYAASSIDALRFHPRYGEFVNKILKKVGVTELLATLVAVAKQEAGGQPIGRYELHRWEPRYNVFSFSLFHVLMNGPGLDARRHLNKSEGQLYHPKNASDLFMAFLKEKDGDADDFFPIPKHAEDFAKFYNGSGWRRTNPNYVRNIMRYRADAIDMIETLLAGNNPTTPRATPRTPPSTPTPPLETPRPQAPARPPRAGRAPEPKRPEAAVSVSWERIGRSNLTIAIQNAHYRYTKKYRGETLLKNKQELYEAANEVSRYLVRRYRSSVYYPREQVAIGKDRLGIFLKFRANRSGKNIEELIRFR